MKLRKVRALIIAFAFAGIPLVTTGGCNPRTGTFEFFRDDDHDFFEEGFFFEEEFYYEDCFFCF